jgi:hypothetical protein
MTIISSSVTQRVPGVTVVVAPYGPRGPVITGTSSSAFTIAPGPAVFTMNEYGLGFTPGVRVRASAVGATDQWVEGIVTDYTDNALSIDVDLTGGDGIYSSWNVNVAGERGAIGPAGPQGATGAVPEAPQDSNKYVRYNAAWNSITGDLNGKQPLDGDLTSLAAASANAMLYYRKSVNTWVPLNLGSGLSLDSSTDTINVSAGGGNVSNTGTPAAGQLARWTSTNVIGGVDGATLFAPVNSPALTGTPTAPTPAAGDNSTQVATTAYVQNATRPPGIVAFTTGAGVYYPSAGARWLRVRMAGGGGAGGPSGQGNTAGSSSSGGNTTFGSLLTAGGGGGAGLGQSDGAGGGAATINAPAVGGGWSGASGTGKWYGGTSTTDYVSGGDGGESPFGGGGKGVCGQDGRSAQPSSGSGGGGGGTPGGVASMSTGSGGGAGGYVDAIIPGPLATSYTYAVGAGGSSGAPGAYGCYGGAGSNGVIVIEEHYS